ncbi:bifunctional DNA-formamidopyrimidine glycosylase/DNA-(apurinic or apyrimidinic site) lyase [Candidatus Uabimicrobium amorphum]|uniref:Formamidopyrimidine-DNA glycosylase n=1 Tax=Uabimicrobium amorphum TaxID=2596890 RepID=A0A5S9IRB0_UABAM|nr:bifunctional DNA-formamidopyrimidine glycosylase/DNA-(apurinic or apyrimidinic site) lyase [Candidatus Uabimicrobium amorphum]BBM86002.1 formamidopyrimidine-DNA glycosylase [Candidatus Uabimicrobium amorphum]
MPELPEVETVARSLQQMFAGRTITKVQCLRKNLRYDLQPRKLNNICKGQSITNILRRGKYMIWQIKDKAIIVHLGMSGRFCKLDKKAAYDKHDHVIFELDDKQQIRYRDPRRFGLIIAIDDGKWQQHSLMVHLGVEPLEVHNPQMFVTKAQKRSLPIKQFIMDQKIIVGVGNIYANEALFASAIHPCTPANALNHQEWRTLLKEIRRVLRSAIVRGGTTLQDKGFSDVEGNHGEFAIDLNVYARKDEPCYFCEETIKSCVIGGRSTFFCVNCQVL